MKRISRSSSNNSGGKFHDEAGWRQLMASKTDGIKNKIEPAFVVKADLSLTVAREFVYNFFLVCSRSSEAFHSQTDSEEGIVKVNWKS